MSPVTTLPPDTHLHFTAWQLGILLLAAPLLLTLLLHGLIRALLFVRAKSAAAWLARNTPTITALLPALIDQLVHGPSVVAFAREVDDAAKARPDDAVLTVLAARAKRLAGGMAVAMLMLFSIGCGPQSYLTGVTGIVNATSQLETGAAGELDSRCNQPMAQIAAHPEAADAVAKAKALATRCDPAEIAYDQVRASDLQLRGMIVQVEADGGSITVGDLLAAVRALTGQAATLVKTIGAIQ